MPICWHRSSFAKPSIATAGDDAQGAMARFLLDQYLNAVAPTNFAATNPDVVKRTKETGGANLVQGFAEPARGRRQRQGHRPAPDRSRRVREGQDDRRDARRGGVRERAVPADPVHSGDRQGRGRAAALRAAAGEPLLHDRPRAPAEPGQMAGRRGPHGVRHQLGQPGRGASRTRASATMCSTASSRRSSRSASAPAPRPTCSPSASAGRWSRSRWPGSRRRAARDEVNSATLIGCLVDFADMRDWSAFVHEGHLGALEDHLEAQGLHRQPGAAAAVRGDARQRPDLVVGGQPLSARQARAAVRPALLVRGWRAHPGRLPQELQSRPAARQQA